MLLLYIFAADIQRDTTGLAASWLWIVGELPLLGLHLRLDHADDGADGAIQRGRRVSISFARPIMLGMPAPAGGFQRSPLGDLGIQLLADVGHVRIVREDFRNSVSSRPAFCAASEVC
jgi:hypothetical protein